MLFYTLIAGRRVTGRNNAAVAQDSERRRPVAARLAAAISTRMSRSPRATVPFGALEDAGILIDLSEGRNNGWQTFC